MACDHCRFKCIAMGLALVAGGAAIGYCVGTCVARKRGRINHCIKLSSDKVALVIYFNF